MIKIVVIESRLSDFSAIEQRLINSATQDFQLQCVDALIVEELSKREFDVILLAHSYANNNTIPILQKIIALNLDKPIIYLTDSFEPKIDQWVMKIGADDCIPKDEITTPLLDRALRHAIQRKKNAKVFSHLATHDQLTGLTNRFLLYEHLEHTISMAKRNKNQFALIFIDLDKFKLINDSLGHDIGDMLLIQVADRLSSCVRETDIVARFGDDEFAILLQDSGERRAIATIIRKIQQAIEPAFNVRNHELFMTTSIGIAHFPECGLDPDTLLKNADSALFKAKELGRNQFHFYTGNLNKQARSKLELEKNLRRALINREFDIHLQPQISSCSNKIVAAEALLRWEHPKYGFISPTVFIPLLEDLGLLVGVESWVLNHVCKIAKYLTDKYGPIRFSVNISGTHFKTGNLKENIYLALQSSSLDAINLEVELTEDIMIEHVEHNNRLLEELKELGVSIALDDFGKGYSSLSYLKNFPADILKLDKAFIDHIVNDKCDSAIVEAMIKLSHKLGIKVVAEGVEEKNQLSQLEQFGCDYIQGYYFARPMPLSDFENFVANYNKYQIKSDRYKN